MKLQKYCMRSKVNNINNMKKNKQLNSLDCPFSIPIDTSSSWVRHHWNRVSGVTAWPQGNSALRDPESPAGAPEHTHKTSNPHSHRHHLLHTRHRSLISPNTFRRMSYCVDPGRLVGPRMSWSDLWGHTSSPVYETFWTLKSSAVWRQNDMCQLEKQFKCIWMLLIYSEKPKIFVFQLLKKFTYFNQTTDRSFYCRCREYWRVCKCVNVIDSSQWLQTLQCSDL